MDNFREYLIKRSKPNKVNIINLNPDILGVVYDELKNKMWFKIWENLNIDHNELESLCDKKFDFYYLKEFCNNLGELDWRVKLKTSELDLVEKDNTFRADVSYNYAFILSMMLLKEIPSPEQFWQHWYIFNNEAMSKNLNINWENNSTLVKWIKEYRPRIEELKSTHEDAFWVFTKDTLEVIEYWKIFDEARQKILNAAEYRCKKAYCALLRELYLVSYLASDENSDLVSKPLIVWWHPVVDIVCKTDAVVYSPTDSKLIALAVYLKTRKSYEYAYKKAASIPTIFGNEMDRILSAPVEVNKKAYDNNTIVLPTDDNMIYFKMRLTGNPEALKDNGVYYRDNVNKATT
jgi:hypothetical protein